MISRSPWMKEQPHPSAPFTPYPRRNLQLFVSSLTRTWLQGSYVHPVPHVEPRSSLFRRKTAHFGFASISKASTEYPRRIVTSSHLSPIYWMHHKKHESIPKSIFGTHTIWYRSLLGTNGRPCFGPDTSPSNGW